MDELNVSFNQLFETSNIDYITGEKNIKKCQNLFTDKSMEDDVFLDAFLYFFPMSPNTEKNDSNFWFIKYKGQGTYNEYYFAVDLLKSLNEYNKDKKIALFKEKVIKCSQKFGEYDLFKDFFSVIKKDYINIVMAIFAYLTKDIFYFHGNFGIKSLPENIQTSFFIQVLKNSIENKEENYKMKKKINQLENLIINQGQEIQELIKRINDLENKTKEQGEKIEQINLRDTIKMCFRYLYKLFYSKFKLKNHTNNFWDQLDIIKIILSKPELSDYKYISDFIEDIQFTQLKPLNDIPHNI